MRVRICVVSPASAAARAIAVAAILVSNVLLPAGILAQNNSSISRNVDTGKAQPLNLTPGCWVIQANVISKGMFAAMAVKEKEEQQKAKSAATRAAFQNSIDILKKSEANNKGQEITTFPCTLTPFSEVSAEIYGSAAPQCKKTIDRLAGGVQHFHVQCPSVDGALVTDDYERIDARTFKGRKVKVHPFDPANAAETMVTESTTFQAKWTGAVTPHMPYSPALTDLKGLVPKGPFAVATYDPYRIVAIINGEQFMAKQAYYEINRISAVGIRRYGPSLADRFENIYIHYEIAEDVLKLHLDQQEPWKTQLANSGGVPNFLRRAKTQIGQIGGDFAVDTSSANHASTEETLRHDALALDPIEEIFWNAYFSQAKTEAGKQALLKTVREKYKLTVMDPDFFAGTSKP
jgi:hypothetical protein